MKAIFGSAGFAREVDWLTEEIYSITGIDHKADFFVTENCSSLIGKSINSKKIISESEFFALASNRESISVIVAVGKPAIKEKIAFNIKSKIPKCDFPNLIHPNASFDTRPNKVQFGEGNIICSMNILTTDILLGNFVHLNLDCTVGHDSVFGDFSTISPGVHVSGNVQISERVFIGTGSVIIENISICSDVIIGAGSVVTKEISLPGTYIGIPARRIK